MKCEHKYIWYDYSQNHDMRIGYHTQHYERIDMFYCEKCLEFKEKRRSETSAYKPEWFK